MLLACLHYPIACLWNAHIWVIFQFMCVRRWGSIKTVGAKCSWSRVVRGGCRLHLFICSLAICSWEKGASAITRGAGLIGWNLFRLGVIGILCCSVRWVLKLNGFEWYTCWVVCAAKCMLYYFIQAIWFYLNKLRLFSRKKVQRRHCRYRFLCPNIAILF